eukprot:scaffold2131_cov384-Prasinococcus_capsulatus_cf.AAC.16
MRPDGWRAQLARAAQTTLAAEGSARGCPAHSAPARIVRVLAFTETRRPRTGLAAAAASTAVVASWAAARLPPGPPVVQQQYPCETRGSRLWWQATEQRHARSLAAARLIHLSGHRDPRGGRPCGLGGVRGEHAQISLAARDPPVSKVSVVAYRAAQLAQSDSLAVDHHPCARPSNSSQQQAQPAVAMASLAKAVLASSIALVSVHGDQVDHLLRWCVTSGKEYNGETELQRCEKMIEILTELSMTVEPDHPLLFECVEHDDCLAALYHDEETESQADITVLDGGDLFHAYKWYGIKVAIAETYQGQVDCDVEEDADCATSYFAVSTFRAFKGNGRHAGIGAISPRCRCGHVLTPPGSRSGAALATLDTTRQPDGKCPWGTCWTAVSCRS